MTSTQAYLPVEGIIQQLRRELPHLRDQYAVDQLAIFGSYARNAQNQASDLDILVAFRVIPGLLKYIALEQHLSDLLGVPVDLVMESALRPEIAAHVSLERKLV